MLDHLPHKLVTQCYAVNSIHHQCVTLLQNEVIVSTYAHLFRLEDVNWELPFSTVNDRMVFGDGETGGEHNHFNILIKFSDHHALDFDFFSIQCFNLITLFQKLNFFGGAICHFNKAALSNTSTILIIVVSHIIYYFQVSIGIVLFDAGFWRR